MGSVGDVEPGVESLGECVSECLVLVRFADPAKVRGFESPPLGAGLETFKMSREVGGWRDGKRFALGVLHNHHADIESAWRLHLFDRDGWREFHS